MAKATPAKLSVPRLSRVFPRKRLFERLDLAREHEIIWIAAPAGSGKTTLVASYLQARKLSSLWYQIDEGDADVASFFYYLGIGANNLAPRSRKPLPLLTADYRAGLPTFTRNFFRGLFGRMKPPAVIVFDNYQDVGRESLLHDVLQRGLAEIPPGLTAIVISRAEPPAPFARLRASGSVAAIQYDEVQLSETESFGIARLHCGSELSSIALQRLHEWSLGWAAALVLSLEHAASGDPIELIERQGEQALLFDFFANEIFRNTDVATQQFLIRTALLPKIIPETAAALTGVRDSRAILEDLIQRNYFTVKHEGAFGEYEYHTLFRSFLLAQLHRSMAPSDLVSLKRRAAQLLTSQGNFADAISLLHEAGELRASLPIVLAHASELLHQGRARTLSRWISSYPESMRNETPQLWYWLGICELPFDPTSAKSHFSNAYQRFKEADDLPWKVLSACSAVDCFIFEWRDLAPLDGWIDELSRSARDRIDSLQPALQNRLSCAMCTALLFRRPEQSELSHWVERVKDVVLKSSDTSLRVKIGPTLLMYYTWFNGDLKLAEFIFDSLRPVAETVDAPPLMLTTWNLMAAGYSWMAGNLHESLAYARAGLDTAEESGVHVWDMFTHMQALSAALLSNNRAEADKHLIAMRALLDVNRFLDAASYHYMAAWYSLSYGEHVRAHEDAKLAVEFAVKGGLPMYTMFARVMLGRTYFELGRIPEAKTAVDDVLSLCSEDYAASVMFLCLLAKSEFARFEGDETTCVAYLQQCIRLGARRRLVASTWEPSSLAELYGKALRHGIEVDYLKSVIRKLAMAPSPHMLETEDWPFPVRIYTLGRFEVLKHDTPIEFPIRASRKLLDALRALLALGGRAVPENRLAEVLWPDAEGDAAARNLATTLHRLRKLLDCEDTIEVRDGRVSLNPRYCWVDARVFERLTDRAGAAGAVPSEADVATLERAVSYYHGPFLGQDSERPWAIPMRTRLHGKFMRQIGRLARYWEHRGDYARAVVSYEQAIDVDPLNEEGYRCLMQCYVRLGKRAEALAVYQRCRKTLAGALGIMPSSETQAVQRRLSDSP
jgi:LuxR family maltose regulon positive regulatory protein